VDALVRHAISYPFEIPGSSFVFNPVTGGTTEMAHADMPETSGRIPVLAIGSNAAPEQLKRKFSAGACGGKEIPAVRVTASGLDVAFAARVSGYGSVPATPVSIQGVSVQVHVTLLTEDQLEHMNATEGVGHAYELREIPEVEVSMELDGRPLLTYCALAGPLLVEGEPVAMEAVESSGRVLDAWSEVRMLGHVAELQGMELDDFVHAIVDDSEFRADVNTRLQKHHS
jgi:hypothetical protein